jgi:hypothetical protein
MWVPREDNEYSEDGSNSPLRNILYLATKLYWVISQEAVVFNNFIRIMRGGGGDYYVNFYAQLKKTR